MNNPMRSKKVRVAVGAGMASVMALTVLPEPAFADTVSDESSFVNKLNALRASRGLRPLAVNGGLTNMARGWSSHMASTGTLAHNPNMASQAPGNWSRLGENVGVGQSVDSLHNAFVASPPHFGNMVNGAYDSVGVGVVQSGSTMWVTVNFMTTQAAPPPAAVAPPPARFAPPPPPRAATTCRKVRRRTVCRTVKSRRATKSRRGGRRTVRRGARRR